MKSISIDSNSILDMSTKKPMSEIIDFSKEYVTTETDKDTVYKAGDGINISSDNTISVDQGDSAAVEPADAATAGIMKLYGETGANSDGTMTQESITDELDNKAPTDSPEFTGTPTAPTPDSSDEGSDRLATTAYVLSLLKDNPEIIDEMLTAINSKLDATTAANTYLTKTTADNTYLTKTTAESTYAKKTDTDNFLEKSSYNGFKQETNCELWFTSGSSSGIYFKKSGITNSAYLRGDGNTIGISVGPAVNAYGSTGINFRTGDASSYPGRVTIVGKELYFNNTKLA